MNVRSNGDDDGQTGRREEHYQLRYPAAQQERKVEEESTEQQEQHSSYRDEAELPVSGRMLAQSMRLATHPPKQESRHKRMGKEHPHEGDRAKQRQQKWRGTRVTQPEEGCGQKDDQEQEGQRENQAPALTRTRSPSLTEEGSNGTPGECKARDHTDETPDHQQIHPCGRRRAIRGEECPGQEPERDHRGSDESGEHTLDPTCVERCGTPLTRSKREVEMEMQMDMPVLLYMLTVLLLAWFKPLASRLVT